MFFDAHLDLAMNAIEWNRDLSQPLETVREQERGMTDKPGRGRGTVTFPEMRRGDVGLCVGTQIARVEHQHFSPVFGWRSPAQAWAMTQAQLAWYEAMTEAGELTPIRDATELDRQIESWSAAPSASRRAIGFVLSLEGADSMVTPAHLERSFAAGLRALGPAHYGRGRYAMGTGSEGGFDEAGRELLREAGRLGLILDVTHLSDECFWEALDQFTGPMWASHQNCRALVPHQRQFSDEQCRALFARGSVIGCALDAWMLIPGWERGKTTPESSGLRLGHFVDHVDHLCQVAGNAALVGFGTDLDGCFGTEQTPLDLQSIADLQTVPRLLQERGFTREETEAIGSGNFIRFLRSAWRALS